MTEVNHVLNESEPIKGPCSNDTEDIPEGMPRPCGTAADKERPTLVWLSEFVHPEGLGQIGPQRTRHNAACTTKIAIKRVYVTRDARIGLGWSSQVHKGAGTRLIRTTYAVSRTRRRGVMRTSAENAHTGTDRIRRVARQQSSVNNRPNNGWIAHNRPECDWTRSHCINSSAFNARHTLSATSVLPL
nr:hypothetical protein Iba_chr15bCG8950 [Ipomoea batatas]